MAGEVGEKGQSPAHLGTEVCSPLANAQHPMSSPCSIHTHNIHTCDVRFASATNHSPLQQPLLSSQQSIPPQTLRLCYLKHKVRRKCLGQRQEACQGLVNTDGRWRRPRATAMAMGECLSFSIASQRVKPTRPSRQALSCLPSKANLDDTDSSGSKNAPFSSWSNVGVRLKQPVTRLLARRIGIVSAVSCYKSNPDSNNTWHGWLYYPLIPVLDSRVNVQDTRWFSHNPHDTHTFPASCGTDTASKVHYSHFPPHNGSQFSEDEGSATVTPPSRHMCRKITSRWTKKKQNRFA
ncbi:uncharacterized protein LY79DRAFT_679580 [Colletotrichum navitas]|uniref:Uncharacterized protein n=1 Tax=Colletotrichum navitas TaxID=681940 RepID=A0AAD8PLJ4_9PEZI|nr:uncharacterized protein LY79DRAFT_679580 [Colletotrichum navitas]KAK1569635.1 hypothetical protein LY79DRAFT_679580 [Colletotrichum navitas]